ncbi:hypothetical protein J2Z69_003525 [Paenibacillus shirakamiensis]|uniref:Uncharacterized protein n=1 Tax=Paenibacillus shirakamiensis TaxID=1265935 RepID=A0ABS4JL59_9BACL|nr:hypothetical protein [Paenibacillus shirakamiensis]MBP2002452.1 hypothetical protein [Paenibacillus shirakamiensis]
MKKIASITAALALSAAFATAASADATTTTTTTTGTTPTTTTTTGTTPTTTTPSTTTTTTTTMKPVIWSDLTIINPPKKWDITKITTFYKDPNGKAWSTLDPQKLEPTGQVIGNWVEIYTWLGKGWVWAPEYTK